ncbi:hypothetical protein A4A49_62950 [Nicotiana attenuata]|uniref:SWIM-type domain-containing protein n=1 Tax=Nicotiana attenuata TaxID=49451 RepID=A0A1J6IVL7_NICAT|nr:hypothetical protein A4A49_62950 [Nicotiana attenuata]
MENIPILLQHSGEWDDNHNFINFHVDAILIKTCRKFEQLLREIAKQLQKDSNTIVIQYVIAQEYPPITICSNMSVSVYMELKKSSAGMTTLPLCVSFAKNTIVASTSSFDVATTSLEIVQFESTNMISTFDLQEADDTSIELDDANIITDQFHQKVEKGQIYKDKNLLALVMTQYAVREKCQYRVLPSTQFLHLVIDGQTRNVVRLHEKNCTCGRFQLDDIPCQHVMAVIQKFHMDSYKYCSDYYSIDYLLKTYEVPVNLLPDETKWQIPEHVSSQVVLPPKGKIIPGRPKKKRGIGGWKGNTITCALCVRKGHNRRTCRNILKRV